MTHTVKASIKTRIALAGLTRDAVARQAGIHPSQFSRYLNGIIKPPPSFAPRALAALDLLERAERAAKEARRHVLDEGAAP